MPPRSTTSTTIAYHYIDALMNYPVPDPDMMKLFVNVDTSKSSVIRFIGVRVMMSHILVPSINDVTCSVLTIAGQNIAYVYSSFNPFTKKQQIMYACVGVNLMSADGEYRGKFIRWADIAKIMRNDEELANELKSIGRSQFKDTTVKTIHFISPKHAERTDFIVNMVDNAATIVLAISWWVHMYLYHYKLLAVHRNPEFYTAVFKTGNPKAFDDIIKKYGEQSVMNIYRALSAIHPSHEARKPGEPFKIMIMPIECGQKMIPLSRNDALMVMNPLRKVWREIIIWNMLSDLTVNMVTPGIPIFNMWFLVYNSSSYLFNNEKMRDRFRSSSSTEPGTPAPDADDDPVDNAKRNAPITSTAKQSTDIDISSHVVGIDAYNTMLSIPDTSDTVDIDDMSNMSLVIVCESVGSTINSTIAFHNSEHYIKRNKDMFAHPSYFSKYLFEIAYTLYCMNSKMGVIHGDLHRNNTTIHSIYHPYYTVDDYQLEAKENDRVVYHVGNNTYFAFPHIIKYGCVIDYSRSIIRPEIIDRHMPRRGDRCKFHGHQVKYIMNWYTIYFPDLHTRYGEKLQQVMTDHFDSVFPCLTAIDMFTHCTLLLDLFKKTPSLSRPSSIKILNRIVAIARKYLEVDIISLITDSDRWGDAIDTTTQWPNYHIINSVFGEFIVTSADMAKYNIVDVFNYDQKIEYSVSSTDRYPRYILPPFAVDTKWPRRPNSDGRDTIYLDNMRDILSKERRIYHASIDKWVAHSELLRNEHERSKRNTQPSTGPGSPTL